MIKRTKDQRQAELAKIHIAKKQLALDDDTYRLLLKKVGGADSAADLDGRGRVAVLNHLAGLGFAGKSKPGRRRAPAYRGRPANMDKRGSRARQMAKIEALLTVGEKPWAYADALAKRICKVDRLAWVPEDELYKIISALRYQAQREGWDLSGEVK